MSQEPSSRSPSPPGREEDRSSASATSKGTATSNQTAKTVVEADDDDEELDAPTLTQSALPGSGIRSGSQTPLSIPSVPRVGIPRALKQWDRYEVVELLGAGGMGAVYKARDSRLNRFVAVKIVHPLLGQSSDTKGEIFVRRFLREARLQASLEHPHICKVFEIGELPKQDADDEAAFPYIAMQLISGKPLHKAQTEMSLFEKVEIIRLTAEALHAAHRQGLVHRDIKPSNIMVERTPEGKFHPYVMDFGLARESAGSDQSRAGVIEGTPRYMSPEQARGDTTLLDRRTDVYALGVTLYETLVGQSPYPATGDVDVLMAVLTAEPKPLRAVERNIPIDLEAITLKCLEKEPAARYDSAKALADDLGRYLDGEPVEARHIGLTRRILRRARKHKALVALGVAFLISLMGLFAYGLRTRILTQQHQQQVRRQAELAKQQAALAQRLGQEIKDMEWLLRSARQLPLHDLDREKVIVRKRMTQLETELRSAGDSAPGLSHYALGRGHLALHEYGQALKQLQSAIDAGNKSADVYYALGLVLGKHFEQAMAEARLSGGGDWAKKQLQQNEPKYLTPAIEALKRSREMKTDAPQYLEGLIAFYQREYDSALKLATAARNQAPWLYETDKLIGDVHYERATQAMDSGANEKAELEFADAVRSYQAAAGVGQSDAEVFDSLAEAWLRQIALSSSRGAANEPAYKATVAAADSSLRAEPHSSVGLLKKANAAFLTLTTMTSSNERMEQCRSNAQRVLDSEPDHPFASEFLAGCNTIAANSAPARGEDPELLRNKAMALMEHAVRKYPTFLWGTNDLALMYTYQAKSMMLRGDPKAPEVLEKAIDAEARARALDDTYVYAVQGALFARTMLIQLRTTVDGVQEQLRLGKSDFEICKKLNGSDSHCPEYALGIHAFAAWRLQLFGQDVQAEVQQGTQRLAEGRKLEVKDLDFEQFAALLHFVDGTAQVKAKKDPALALAAMSAAVKSCLEFEAQDDTCLTLAAQVPWVEADWLSSNNRSPAAPLKRSLELALRATQSPQPTANTWQVLAETYLRMAHAEQARAPRRDKALAAGLEATTKIFAQNTRHALGHATQGALLLLRAQALRDPDARRSAAQAAITSLDQALRDDAFLIPSYSPLLAQAKALLTAN